MAGFKSDYLANAILNEVYGAAAFSAPATLYCALFTVAPTSAGGGTEVTGGSYARVSKTNNTTNFPTTSSKSKTNGTAINFGTATADWGTIVGAAWFDASSGGNMIAYGPFGTSVSVLNGGSFQIAASGMTITEA